MSNDIAIVDALKNPGDGPPWCNVCNKPVDHIGWAHGIKRMDWNGMIAVVHTGETVSYVKCHGEEYYFSNLRGEVTRQYYEAILET